jgi:pimeloyl-ACP methyl ester carboxylesterase
MTVAVHLVCLPGFADTARSWPPLLDALSARGHDGSVIDLPGFGAVPRREQPMDIGAAAEEVAGIVRDGGKPVALVGHSIGSVIAVRAARLLGDQCTAVVSIEGNLTPDDAYFSGQAARYADPATFKHDYLEQIEYLVAAGRAPASYAESVALSDPDCMWIIGRDVATAGADGSFGREFRDLPTPTLYLWCESTTPVATQKYLTQLRHRQLSVEHHWPWMVDSGLVAGIIAEFTAAPG